LEFNVPGNRRGISVDVGYFRLRRSRPFGIALAPAGERYGAIDGFNHTGTKVKLPSLRLFETFWEDFRHMLSALSKNETPRRR
jgi:hypothetical protein